jgi:exonuclease-1
MNRSLGNEAHLNGDEKLAQSYFKKSVGVNFEMILQLIDVLRKNNIDFLVSPYEADAQLAFLSRAGLVDIVITEDSDCLVYGCRRILLKLDRDGNGEEIKRENLGRNEDFSFMNWTDDQFKLFCTLTGCDYVPKLRNVGIKTAYQYVGKYKCFDDLAGALKRSTFKGVTDDYLQCLYNAFLTFKHQVHLLFHVILKLLH